MLSYSTRAGGICDKNKIRSVGMEAVAKLIFVLFPYLAIPTGLKANYFHIHMARKYTSIPFTLSTLYLSKKKKNVLRQKSVLQRYVLYLVLFSRQNYGTGE